MFVQRKAIPRRAILRGIGTAVALPFLDSMTPAFAAGATKPPVRMAFVYVPNGIDMRNWNPESEGPLGELPRILKPMEPLKNDMLLLGNLTHNTGRALLESPPERSTSRCRRTRNSGSWTTRIDAVAPPRATTHGRA